jgi:hypothetical protein
LDQRFFKRARSACGRRYCHDTMSSEPFKLARVAFHALDAVLAGRADDEIMQPCLGPGLWSGLKISRQPR